MAGRTLGIIGCGRIGSRVYQRLQSFGFKFLTRDLSVAKDFRKKPRAERFALVDRNNRAAPIGMTQETMASPRADNLKAKTSQDLDNVLAGESTRGRHAEMRTL
jgi:hypothetical protein